jgi:ComF family protein
LLNIRIAQALYRGFWSALDWMYPPTCVGCGEPGYRLCFNCQEKIHYIDEKVCEFCGFPFEGEGSLCTACQKEPPAFTAQRYLARYEGVIRECVHALKYHQNLALGEFFGQKLTGIVREEAWDLDLVIPVPLSPIRQVERGYNQAALLARPLALNLGVPFAPFGLKRIRNTQSQVDLNADQRRQNVRGAFQAVPDIVRDKRICLVDDVTTTGSTLRECTLALLEGGASAVYCLTLARPIHVNTPIPLDSPSSII